MKTLDQIEARTPISSLPFTITSSGSYYVTGNLTGVKSETGITVNASNVTIDLNGFTLTGVGGALDGISTTASNVRVHNGTVANWPMTGVKMGSAASCEIDHVRATSNGDGLSVGNHGVVSYCLATNSNSNTGIGINAPGNALLSHCMSTGNFVGANFEEGARAEECVFSNNSIGVIFGFRCSFTRCTANGNTAANNGGNGFNATGYALGASFLGCAASNNHGTGIIAGSHANVTGCTVTDNTGPGILAGGDSLLQNNNSSDNGAEGIKTTGVGNRIDGNLARSNGSYGLSSGTNSDFIVRNTCSNNNGTSTATASADYNPKSGIYFGVFSHPGDASPSAWANF